MYSLPFFPNRKKRQKWQNIEMNQQNDNCFWIVVWKKALFKPGEGTTIIYKGNFYIFVKGIKLPERAPILYKSNSHLCSSIIMNSH